MTETKQNILKVGDNYEIKIPLESWKTIDVTPGDIVEFSTEEQADPERDDEYFFIRIRKQPTIGLDIPTKEYLELQGLIDRREIPSATVEEAVADAIEKMVGVN